MKRINTLNIKITLLYLCYLAPRQQRMCLCLAWNETDPNLLAIGHDRYRSDSCITIWDTERGLPKESGRLQW